MEKRVSGEGGHWRNPYAQLMDKRLFSSEFKNWALSIYWMTFLRGMFIAHPFTPRTSFIPISIGRYVYQIEGEDFDFPEIITDGSFAPTRRLMGHHAIQNKNGTVPPCASLRLLAPVIEKLSPSTYCSLAL